VPWTLTYGLHLWAWPWCVKNIHFTSYSPNIHTYTPSAGDIDCCILTNTVVDKLANKNYKEQVVKKSDKKPHGRKADFSRGKVSMTPASLEQCSNRADAVIDFSCVHRSSDSQFFLVGGTTPKIFYSPWGSVPPSNWWFLGSTRVTHPNGISICSSVLAGLTNVTNRQTGTQTERQTTLFRL